MARFITSSCGVVLELDKVPGTPGKYCPACREPLDERAVADTCAKPTDQNQPGFPALLERHNTIAAIVARITERDPFTEKEPENLEPDSDTEKDERGAE